MYSHLIARIKPVSDYENFLYTGKTIELPFRGITRPLAKGQRFGVRRSSNGKEIRLVIGDDITRVITLTPELAQKLAKHCEAI